MFNLISCPLQGFFELGIANFNQCQQRVENLLANTNDGNRTAVELRRGKTHKTLWDLACKLLPASVTQSALKLGRCNDFLGSLWMLPGERGAGAHQQHLLSLLPTSNTPTHRCKSAQIFACCLLAKKKKNHERKVTEQKVTAQGSLKNMYHKGPILEPF